MRLATPGLAAIGFRRWSMACLCLLLSGCDLSPHPATPTRTVGAVDTSAAEKHVGLRSVITGWAFDPAGIDYVEARTADAAYKGEYGLTRKDVGTTAPGGGDMSRSGFRVDIPEGDRWKPRQEARIVAINKRGIETVLGTRSLVSSDAMQLWSALLDDTPGAADQKFYFVMAASAISLGGLKDVDTQYPDLYSRTMRVGVAVPILYLRATHGAASDWTFNAAFSLKERCKQFPVTEDSLDGLMKFAVEHQMPVQFILNGGVWANSSCESVQWDIADHLEQDANNCQWSQSNVVFPRDYLKNLTGSLESPELARSLTYNVYASSVRRYKKRNLQSAARLIAAFASSHPDLFIGVSLDADTYMNPFYEQKEWFDYNPGTIRQFRDWLRGAGPYAGRPTDGAPDLSTYRRSKPLTLADVNRLARAHWTRWDQVDPPRTFPGTPHDPPAPGRPVIWDDPWYQVWDAFRKHLVALHYSELSEWVHETGIPVDKIFSAQGFVAPGPMLHPFAVSLDSHGQNYDSAGVSVEGSIPRFGHLGAILYGEAAENKARMEVPYSLLATFSRMDPGWAVVEFNSTDLHNPSVLPTYAQAYRSFRDFFNYDASQVTAMAWNGSDGADAGKKGFSSYTAWKNTSMEDAMRDFLVTHANIPRGARVWTFGSGTHVDDDGWSVVNGRAVAGNSSLDVELGTGTTDLLSPPDQVLRAYSLAAVVLAVDGMPANINVRVLAHMDATDGWREIARDQPLMAFTRTAAGFEIPLNWGSHARTPLADQIKLELTATPSAPTKIRFRRIVLYPNDAKISRFTSAAAIAPMSK